MRPVIRNALKSELSNRERPVPRRRIVHGRASVPYQKLCRLDLLRTGGTYWLHRERKRDPFVLSTRGWFCVMVYLKFDPRHVNDRLCCGSSSASGGLASQSPGHAVRVAARFL